MFGVDIEIFNNSISLFETTASTFENQLSNCVYKLLDEVVLINN